MTDYKYHTQGKHDMLNRISISLVRSPIPRLPRRQGRRQEVLVLLREACGLRRQCLVEVAQFAALEHPVVQAMRDVKEGTAASGLIRLDIEKEKVLTEGVLQAVYQKEIHKYHPEVPVP